MKKQSMKKKGLKKGRGEKRSQASFKQNPSTGKALSEYKYDSKPSTIMKDSVEGTESRADRELRRLMRGDVFRSNKQTVKATNSNPRRNK